MVLSFLPPRNLFLLPSQKVQEPIKMSHSLRKRPFLSPSCKCSLVPRLCLSGSWYPSDRGLFWTPFLALSIWKALCGLSSTQHGDRLLKHPQQTSNHVL